MKSVSLINLVLLTLSIVCYITTITHASPTTKRFHNAEVNDFSTPVNTHRHNRETGFDYSNGPFSSSASSGSAGLGRSPFKQHVEGNENHNAQSPFSTHGLSSGSGMKGSPFSSMSSTGSKHAGAGPFSGASSGGSGAVGEGIGTSPFSSAANSGSTGSGPFSGGHGSTGMGAGPFASVNGHKNNTFGGASPFSSKNGMQSGPGGLTGSNFNINNAFMAGHDFSQELVGSRKYGNGKSGQINGALYSQNMGNTKNSDLVGDQSTFDTSAYQNMIQNLFQTNSIDSQLSDLGGSPFNGDSYKRPKDEANRGETPHNTAKDSSVGSYADMTGYDSSVGKSGSQSSFSTNGYNSNRKSSNSYGPGYTHGSFSSDKNNDYKYDNNKANNLKDYDSGSPFQAHGSSSSYGGLGNGMGQSPFSVDKVSGEGNGKSPFATSKLSNNGNNPFGMGKYSNSDNSQNPFNDNKFASKDNGQNPFDTSKFSNSGTGQSPFNAHKLSNSGTNGQNPFDTSKFSGVGNGQEPFGTSNGLGYQTSSNNHEGSIKNLALDKYGNVDFAKLSKLSNSMTDSGSSAGMGMSSYTGTDSTYSSERYSGSGGYSGDSDSRSYSGNLDLTDSESVGDSAGQYKTPFESDNYNDLIDNPFSSSKYFDSDRQNFKAPYEEKDTLGYSRNGATSGYSSQTYNAEGTGPAGNPFNQGGHSMASNVNMRGGR